MLFGRYKRAWSVVNDWDGERSRSQNSPVGIAGSGEPGEEIVIARAGRPMARLVPVREQPERRVLGSASGQVVVRKDFDAPLPEEVLEAFER